jgi:microcystin-dependent protein
MTYNIEFSDSINNTPLIVNDNTINTQTSLAFPGRNQVGYSSLFGENFLHLLENFSNTTSPDNPVQGQLWYDSSEGVNQLKIYNGTNWLPAGSINKSTTAPTTGAVGDLWVDTIHQQLYLYSGVNWILVGPTFSSGLKSGLQVEIVQDSTGVDRTVLKTYLNDQVVSIYSTQAFVPKIGINGFSTIYPGVNVSSANFTSGAAKTKLWGISEKAESLIVNNIVVPSSSFLRSDTPNLTTYPISIRTDAGITVGSENQLKLQITSAVGTIYHSTPQSALDLQINKNGLPTTLVRLDARTGNIGINNPAPQATLDVNGTAIFSGDVRITSTTDSLTSATGALIVDGGMTVFKEVNLLYDSYCSGTFWLDYGTGLPSNTTYPGLLPTSDNLDIGGNDPTNGYYPFASVYAKNFIASTDGKFVGNLTGNVSGHAGSASRLQASTKFTMEGDVADIIGFSFDGLTSSIFPYTVSGFISKIGSGPYFVTLSIPTQTSAPDTNINYVVEGNDNPLYNGIYFCTSSTTSTIVLQYGTSPSAVDPGNYGTGTTTVSSTASLTKKFNTSISPNFILNKDEVTEASDSDILLVYRPPVVGSTDPSGLVKTTKPNFVKSLPLVPVGCIFPFAGSNSNLPTGYLLCDGSEQLRAKYKDLYDVISYLYGDPSTLVGINTFKLPDLRGRFPLGLDNMDNNTYVPTNVSTQKTITTPAGRVNDVTATVLGNSKGNESNTIELSNLPQHTHTLEGDAGTQFYATNTTVGTPLDTGSTNNFGTSGTGEAIDRTGLIINGNTIPNPINVMNPYLSINYIIYVGKVYSV